MYNHPQLHVHAENDNADPMDLRSTVDAVFNEITACRAELPRGQPLVALIGETHSASAYTLFQTLLLENLNAGPSVACGLEIPHNAHTKPISSRNERKILKDFLNSSDFSPVEAPVATRIFFESLYKNAISTRFNDLARTSDPGKPLILDQKDLLTQKIVRENAPGFLSDPIGIGSADGLRLRNIGIAENILRHAEQGEAEIYVQSVGLYHVCPLKSCYEHTLTYALEDRGIDVLPIFLLPKSLLSSLSDHKTLNSPTGAIVVSGLPENKFHAGDEPQERAFCQEILEASRAQNPPMTPKNAIPLLCPA